ncbi:MAG: SNF2-related protein [Acetobacteraceae bacterium]
MQLPPNRSNFALSDADIRHAFTANTLEAGRIYELRGRVRNLEVSDDGSVITAETLGTAPDPYRQRITLRLIRPMSLVISGTCTCPVGRQCKHVAAVLIAAHRLQAAAQSIASPPAQKLRAVQPPAEEQLPYPIVGWLSDLQSGVDDDSEEYPPNVRNRLHYVLSRDESQQGTPSLVVQPYSITLRKNGGFSNVRQFPPHQIASGTRFLRPSDRLILPRLARRTTAYTRTAEEDPNDTLRRVLATGRARWLAHDGPPLSEGPARPGQITWDIGRNGTQNATLSLEDGLLPVRVPAPWYIDPATGLVGPVSLDLPASLAVRLLSAPPIPADAVPKVREELARRLPSIAIPGPRDLPAPTRIDGPPMPHLRLMNGTLPMDPAHGRGSARLLSMGLYAVPLARLTFDYGPIAVPCSQRPQPRLFVHDGTLYEPARDHEAEAGAVDRLAMLGFGRVDRLVPVYYQHAHTDDFALLEGEDDADWVTIVMREAPALREQGWRVEIDENFPLQIITTEADINAELIEGSGIDWLELHLGVMVDGERIDLVPALVKLLGRTDLAVTLEGADDAPFLLPLADGRKLALPLGRIRPTLQALIELYDSGVIGTGTERIGFTRLDAADLAALEARAGLIWRGGEALRDLGRQLREAGGAIPRATVPADFKGALRPYQAQGVDWLQFLRGAGLGGVLADDMGLGKTVQTLAHLMIEKDSGRLDKPALIVCPTSLIPNWLNEAERFTPALKVLALHGPQRKAHFKAISRVDLVLTTYPLLTRDYEALTAQDWHVVILDEAQTIKNPNAETTRQALRLKARQRLCLSGTPLQNHLGELWSLFDFLAPGFLGTQKGFKARFRTPIEKYGDEDRSTLLTRRVRPFLLRRTKEEVATDLPPKTEITERIEMESGQQAIYEGIRLAMHARVKAAIAEKGVARSGIVILDALLKMRQACCDPRLLKLKSVAKSKAGSAKLDRLMEMLAVMLAEGRRVLLFSQFTEMLALIERRLWDEKIDYVMLTGDTKDRSTPVRRFQKGDVPLFLISLKAGGVGLNLTAADTVIHYDPWWNPAVEDQATDRAHRIGQDKKVFVHRLVTLGTIEEKMEVLKEKKRALVSSVVEAEHGGALKLTETDVEDLFGAA